MTPAVALTGHPEWAEFLAEDLAHVGLQLVRYQDARSLIQQLVEDGVVLLLVDGALEDWRYWTSAARNSPATRRIPVVVVADEGDISAAQTTGASELVHPDDLRQALPRLLEQVALLPDLVQRQRLLRQCDEPLPAEALEGIRLFNAGEYYRQHDVFEALWMAEHGPVRDLYRAMLQVGIACYQITRLNHRGAMKMLLRCQPWLNALPEVCRGVSVAGLREDVAVLQRALAATEPAHLASFDLSLLPLVRLIEVGRQ